MNLKFISVFLVIFSLSFSGQGYAKDACSSVLCLSGMMAGAKPSKCKQPTKDYFDIQVSNRGGKLSYGKTANKRNDFLKQCTQAQAEVELINATYRYAFPVSDTE